MQSNGKVINDRPAGQPDPNVVGPPEQHLIEAFEQVLHHRLTEHLAEHLAEVERRMAGHVREAVSSGRRQVGHAVDVCTPA